MRVQIVSAAICRNGMIYSMPAPARHHTILIALDGEWGDSHPIFLPSEQGFLGSDGRFYGREEAAIVAIDAGQIGSTKFGGKDLYSEDLW